MNPGPGLSSDRAGRLATATAMADVLQYRGPDDNGVWDENTGITLAHRRLAILDISAEGHQPMLSMDGRYAMTYNGEVYNFAELRHELEAPGMTFRGHSDTEVMLAAFQAWGVEQSIKRFTGMFAIAVWDRKSRELKLIRDRLGIKPLYYGWVKGVLLFGSELKAFKVYPGFIPEINRDALCLYMRHNYIPAPHSIYAGIYKLLPGHVLSAPLGARGLPDARDDTYWSLRQVAETGMGNWFRSDEETLFELEEVLRDAVRCRMIADVPLGAFLSGGVDSSTVVALMQSLGHDPVRTFSIGFQEPEYDEAAYARRVAEHLGTNHTELYVSPEEALKVIPLLPQMFDEPFSDSSQIPTYLVSRLARREVTVSLSGDGGDELFAGYERYFRCVDVWQKLSRVPLSLRSMIAATLQVLPLPLLKPAVAAMQSLTRHEVSADRLRKFCYMLSSRSVCDLYLGMLSHWHDPAAVVRGGQLPDYFLSETDNWAISREAMENMSFADMNTYLPGDILTKLDRASMAVSLEGRVPLLDHRVVELSWRLPMSTKLRDGKGKWPLRQILYKHVPREMIERPKKGFGVPIDTWLRGPLREWASALLEPTRLAREGFFEVDAIQQKWHEHLSGKRRWHYLLWDVIMFQAWLEQP